MNSIENMLSKVRVLEASDKSSSFKDCLKEIVQYGQEFLEGYGFDDGIGLYSESSTTLLEAFDIVPRSDVGYAFRYSTISNQYQYKAPDDCHQSKYFVSLAYILALKLFRPVTHDFCIRFEAPLGFSSSLTIFEKAFAYSIIAPYSRYKKLFTTFCSEMSSKWEKTEEFVCQFTESWIHSAVVLFRCDPITITIIGEFYQNLFSDELTSIYKDALDNAWTEVWSPMFENSFPYCKQTRKKVSKTESTASPLKCELAKERSNSLSYAHDKRFQTHTDNNVPYGFQLLSYELGRVLASHTPKI